MKAFFCAFSASFGKNFLWFTKNTLNIFYFLQKNPQFFSECHKVEPFPTTNHSRNLKLYQFSLPFQSSASYLHEISCLTEWLVKIFEFLYNKKKSVSVEGGLFTKTKLTKKVQLNSYFIMMNVKNLYEHGYYKTAKRNISYIFLISIFLSSWF